MAAHFGILAYCMRSAPHSFSAFAASLLTAQFSVVSFHIMCEIARAWLFMTGSAVSAAPYSRRASHFIFKGTKSESEGEENVNK